MTKPQSSELEALRESGNLLRFVAESAKELPETIVSSITGAWKAEQEDQWNPDIATKFWVAYSALCSLIKPVSLDSISANFKATERPAWKLWPRLGPAHSLSRRTADRYLLLLMILLVVAVALGFIVSAVASLNSENVKLVENGTKAIEKITSDVDMLELAIGNKSFSDPSIPEEQKKRIKLIQLQFQDLDFTDLQMLQKTEILTRLLHLFGMEKYTFSPGTLKPDESLGEFRAGITNFYNVRQDVISRQQQALIIVSIISSAVLPVILGMMGACAYVVRYISDQIKDTTFSTTSPIRHLLRVALGALAGVVIGFSGIFTGAGISPAALSFIAGYAVEPVFATIDGIAEKFKRPV